jgi:hypothetical protein
MHWGALLIGPVSLFQPAPSWATVCSSLSCTVQCQYSLGGFYVTLGREKSCDMMRIAFTVGPLGTQWRTALLAFQGSL